MGKKHKKHKSEKHGYEEYGERPLKLVLKVSGNEVTTEDTKVKKKMTKKKKGQETDGDDERSRTPIRSELDKLEEKEQTPLQEALNQLIRQLQRKDPSAFFSFPVTDLVAPGYSVIIKRPMDFSTIKEKVKKEYYQSLDEIKVDFKIMCENAMIYNKPETIFHRAARKLLHSGMKILSQERLESLKQSITFMSGLDPSDEKPGTTKEQGGGANMDQNREGASSANTSERPLTPRKEKDSKDEAAKAEKELEEIRKVITESGGKLSSRVLQSDLEFARRKTDGSTTLAVLNPADLAAGDVGFCPVKLGMMSNRLQSGMNSLQGFREDKRNRITPVSYVNYGPYTSYAPTYDSSFSNISKDDSDLICSVFGEEAGPQGPDSLKDFLVKSDEYVYKMADNLLDALTNGEHSKSLKENQQVEETPKTPENTVDMKTASADGCYINQLRTETPLSGCLLLLAALQLPLIPCLLLQLFIRFHSIGEADPVTPDCSRLDFLLPTAERLSGDARHFQEKLDETTKLLCDLQEAQRERLSAKQPPNMICLLAPTTKELELAEKVTGNLAALTGQVAPCDVSSVYGIRRAMGISVPLDPPGLFIDLTTVQETAEPMETDSVPIIAV
ncbi:hypothetical protein JOQ06_009489 [Pogonophryne albipinna]|uniref:Bromo domain-containing protein n=1 Tax=Pogonophryne albipinna TaxID=1090488 RepID=A0AAD6BR81_9TELE|nr:hypothetical protein JOQ06_009489 [Pogonophryne albipinna]